MWWLPNHQIKLLLPFSFIILNRWSILTFYLMDQYGCWNSDQHKPIPHRKKEVEEKKKDPHQPSISQVRLLRSHWPKHNSIWGKVWGKVACKCILLIERFTTLTKITFISKAEGGSWILGIQLDVSAGALAGVSSGREPSSQENPWGTWRSSLVCQRDTTAKWGDRLPAGKSTLAQSAPLHRPPSTQTWEGESCHDL